MKKTKITKQPKKILENEKAENNKKLKTKTQTGRQIGIL